MARAVFYVVFYTVKNQRDSCGNGYSFFTPVFVFLFVFCVFYMVKNTKNKKKDKKQVRKGGNFRVDILFTKCDPHKI